MGRGGGPDVRGVRGILSGTKRNGIATDAVGKVPHRGGCRIAHAGIMRHPDRRLRGAVPDQSRIQVGSRRAGAA